MLLVLAALLSATTIWWEIGPHDEGLMLQAAERIPEGQWPWRDFWWNYGPGQPVVLAGLTELFGPSLMTWRVLRVALDAIVALLVYRLARRAAREVRPSAGAHTGVRRLLAPEALALLAWLAAAGSMAFPTGPGPNPAALALGVGGLLAAPRRPVAGGALAGAAAIFRPELGVAAAIGTIVAAGGHAARVRAGVAAVAAAVAGWLPFLVVAPRELLDDLAGFLAVQDLQRTPLRLDPSGVGLDPNKLLELWLPLILLAGVAVAVAARPRGTALATAPLVVAGAVYLLGRTDEFHLAPLAVVLPVALVGARHRAVGLAGAAVVALIAVHGVERRIGQLVHMPALAPVPGPSGDGVRMAAGEARDLRGLLAFVGDRSMFVAPSRFDQVTVGNPLLYVIARKDNLTRYDVMQPGIVTTAEVQREMIADLRRAQPETLVRWHDPRTDPEDNASGRSSGVRLLDDHLRATFRPAARFGSYEVHVRGTR